MIKQNLEVSLQEAKDGYTWPLFAQFAEVQPILWGEIERCSPEQKEPQEASTTPPSRRCHLRARRPHLG